MSQRGGGHVVDLYDDRGDDDHPEHHAVCLVVYRYALNVCDSHDVHDVDAVDGNGNVRGVHTVRGNGKCSK